MALIKFLTIVTLITLLTACGNASTEHAKQTVLLLRKMRLQAQTGETNSVILHTLSDAKLELSQVDERDKNRSLLSDAVEGYQSAIDMVRDMDDDINSGDYGRLRRVDVNKTYDDSGERWQRANTIVDQAASNLGL